ncbi:hypothetical protein NW759_017431 [Fusarium solani]|nr:hypothetical protein NW759_017431 [Fusarium solani]
MGLHSLMIWNTDLGALNLEVLRAISKGEHTGGTKAPFSLVDHERFFPAEMLLLEDAETSYAHTNFGSDANADESSPN